MRDAHTYREACLWRPDRDAEVVVWCGLGWDAVSILLDRGTCFASIALHHFVHVVDAGNNGVILEW